MGKDDLQAFDRDLLMFATTEDALEYVRDRVACEQSRGLDLQAFVEARAALPDRRFASGYVDHRQVSDVLGDNL